MRRILSSIFVFVGLAFAVAACDPPDSSAARSETAAVERQQQQYLVGQPVPQFDFSLERDVAIQLYSARNQNVATHTVWRSDFGKVLGDCPSIGYPIPYDVQLTNPQYIANSGHQYGYAILEQAEPNGLYSSKNSIATWIRCITEDGTQVPVYVEDKVTAYPYPVAVDYDTDRVAPAGAATVVIDAK